jgi:thiol:disulfide interchange protein
MLNRTETNRTEKAMKSVSFLTLVTLLTLATSQPARSAHSAHSAHSAPMTTGARAGVWTMDMSAATRLAKSAQLPILINFTGSDWCHWCIHMEKHVFSQAKWKTFATKNAVLLTIDFPRDKSRLPAGAAERNAALASRFGVPGYPTFVVLDVDGTTELGRLGASQAASPDDFIKKYQAIAKFNSGSIAKLAKRNPARAKELQTKLAGLRGAKSARDKWMATRPLNTPENQQRLKDYQTKIEKAEAGLAGY